MLYLATAVTSLIPTALHVPVGSTLHRSPAPVCVSEFEKQNEYVAEMRETARRISRPGRGILATDESGPTAGKRLSTVGLSNTDTNRRTFRELLYTTAGLSDYISGVIMFDETVYQETASGERFTDVLKDAGIVVGVKVDTGLQPLSGTNGETATQGLDGLAERCRAYYEAGARFSKWRAVFKIGDGMPSERAINENAHTLGRYASICQEHGLLPIVEPEVTLGPGDYTIEQAAYESQRVLSHVFRALNSHDVVLEAILVKPSMVLPGLDASFTENDPEEVCPLIVHTPKSNGAPAPRLAHARARSLSAARPARHQRASRRWRASPPRR